MAEVYNFCEGDRLSVMPYSRLIVTIKYADGIRDLSLDGGHSPCVTLLRNFRFNSTAGIMCNCMYEDTVSKFHFSVCLISSLFENCAPELCVHNGMHFI